MQKVRKRWIVFLIMTFLLLAMVLLVYMLNIPWERQNGMYVHYEGMLFSSNEKYNGVIDLSKKRVSILDQSQKEVSGVDIKKCYPDQIVLGKTTYFLLYRQYNENGDAKIVQYNYQSAKKQEYMSQNTAVINYKNGYLFMGNWNEDGEYKYSFISCEYAFHANNYIKEEDFGQQPEQLEQVGSENCMIGNTELYYHKGGYFSMEPPLDGYPGLSRGTFRTSDKNQNYQAETKQEITNRSLLLSEIDSISGAVYEVFEYQMANEIYGLCNVFEEGEYISSLPHESKDVKTSYFYKINPERNEIKILLKKDSCIGLILSNNEAVYQDNNRIMHHDFQTGNEKEIYQINNEHNVQLYIKKDSLMVIEEKKRAFASIFPTNESLNSVLKWKLLL